MRYIKLIIPVILFTMLSASCVSGTGKGNVKSGLQQNDTGTARITFNEYEHSFGKVAEGEKVSYIFEFENTGTGNLIIASAVASCGCTVPKFNKKPLGPGEKGTVEVVFDTSGRNGIQTKTITVKSNADKPLVLLKVTADVENT